MQSNQIQNPKTLEIAFYLVPGFSLTGFSAALDPLQTANRLAGKQLYRSSVLTSDGESLKSSCGISVDAEGAPQDTNTKFDLVIICAGFTSPADLNSRPLHDWIRKLASLGSTLGAISTGSEILAKAGVLDGYRCTIHWENEDSFRETYPKALLTGGIYELDKTTHNCSGRHCIFGYDFKLDCQNQRRVSCFSYCRAICPRLHAHA